mgnify:FL=1|jgi:hypothetical protein
MSKNSHKALYEQLVQWIPTLKSKRKKRSRVNKRTNG